MNWATGAQTAKLKKLTSKIWLTINLIFMETEEIHLFKSWRNHLLSSFLLEINIEKHDFNIFKVSSTSRQELYFTPPTLLFVYLCIFKSIGEHQWLLSRANKKSIKLLQQETLFPKLFFFYMVWIIVNVT